MSDEDACRRELDKSGRLVFVPRGGSMYPALRPNTDTVVLVKPSGRLKRLDIALYAQSGGKLILHRVIHVGNDGYTFSGDNLRNKEYGVKPSQIIGVMESYYRGERHISADSVTFRLCGFLWYMLPPFVTRGIIKLWLKHK